MRSCPGGGSRGACRNHAPRSDFYVSTEVPLPLDGDSYWDDRWLNGEVVPPSTAPSLLVDAFLPLSQSVPADPVHKFAGGGLPPPAESEELSNLAQLIQQPLRTTATMTTAERWWIERYAEPYVESRQRRWQPTTTTAALGILRRVPDTFRRAGVTEPPTTPSEVTEAHLVQLRSSNLLSPNGLGLTLTLLRGLLRHYKAPLAGEEYDDLWHVRKVDLGRRRWLEPDQARALWNAADDRARVMIGFGLFAGLRRIEMLRLHVRDVDLTLPTPTLRVMGKGMKPRSVDISPALYAVLLKWTYGKAPADPVWSWSETEADRTLQEAARASQAFRLSAKGYSAVSWHDLRRTFIRQALETGRLLETDVAEMVGHSNTSLMVRYAGVNRTKARAALIALEQQLGVTL